MTYDEIIKRLEDIAKIAYPTPNDSKIFAGIQNLKFDLKKAKETVENTKKEIEIYT